MKGGARAESRGADGGVADGGRGKDEDEAETKVRPPRTSAGPSHPPASLQTGAGIAARRAGWTIGSCSCCVGRQRRSRGSMSVRGREREIEIEIKK